MLESQWDMAKEARPVNRMYEFTFDMPKCRLYNSAPPYFQVSQDGPLEVFDVMCSRQDVLVEIVDMGSQRFVATLIGPWLMRRETSLVELLQVANDLLLTGDKKRTATMVDLVRRAIEDFPQALIRSLFFPPNDAIQVRVTPKSRDAETDQHVTVWLKAVQWVNL